MTFTDFNLSDEVIRAVTDLGFETPTPIQELMIPQLMTEADDVVGLAHTGTGKTAAFGLPIISEIDLDDHTPQVLVLCPTRELCIQIAGELNLYGKYSQKLAVTSIYGGDSYDRQQRELRRGSHIIVATPGRLLDLLSRGSANINTIRFLVLDEADIMLNMGFKDELDAILESAPEERQTVLLSATMPNDVVRIAKSYMKDPIELSAGQKNTGTQSVEHVFYRVRRHDKYEALKRLVDYHPGMYAIVFCRTRVATQEIAAKMVREGYNAESLHGDLSQTQREQVMRKFRSKAVQLLVATDIAARGLDVDDLTHVIHFDLPTEADAYTHRSGRTGRAGKSGISLSLVTLKEQARVRWIERTIQRSFTEGVIPGRREICEQQLMQLMDRVRDVDVNNEEMASYLPMIEERLGSMSREELLTRFVSLEFNRFLDYYQGMKDLRTDEGPKRRERPGRGFDRKHDSGSDRRKKRQHRKTPRRRGSEGYEWLELNVGREKRVLPLDIIGLVNRSTNSGHIRLGKIDIGSKTSRIQVEPEAVEDVQSGLGVSTYHGIQLKAKRVAGGAGAK